MDGNQKLIKFEDFVYREPPFSNLSNISLISNRNKFFKSNAAERMKSWISENTSHYSTYHMLIFYRKNNHGTK